MKFSALLTFAAIFLCLSCKKDDVKSNPVNHQMDDIKVSSYNLRYNTSADGENAWPNRKDHVNALIQYHNFDIIGTQEVLIDQIKDVDRLEDYTYYGKGRNDGKEAGEHVAIFYKKNKFRLLQSGDFWFSETPDKPSKGWDATCCNRICSWIKLEDIKSKSQFFVFNAHFDHQGAIARKESGKLLIKKIQEIAGNTPVICTGDFNSLPTTEQIATIQTLLNDAYKVSQQPPYGPIGTSNGFNYNAPLQNRIDYIFVSKLIKVLNYAVLTDALNQRYPSDHLPVVAQIVIP